MVVYSRRTIFEKGINLQGLLLLCAEFSSGCVMDMVSVGPFKDGSGTRLSSQDVDASTCENTCLGNAACQGLAYNYISSTCRLYDSTGTKFSFTYVFSQKECVEVATTAVVTTESITTTVSLTTEAATTEGTTTELLTTTSMLTTVDEEVTTAEATSTESPTTSLTTVNAELSSTEASTTELLTTTSFLTTSSSPLEGTTTYDLTDSSSVSDFFSTATTTPSQIVTTDSTDSAKVSSSTSSSSLTTDTETSLSSVHPTTVHAVVVTTTSLHTTTSDPGKPRCDCTCVNSTEPLEQKMIRVKNSMSVDVASLSSTKRKLTSAEDKRQSATNVGVGALALMIAIFALFPFLDILSMRKTVDDMTYEVF